MEARLPFFYGWVIVAVAFVTMGVGVNARTAFSLLFPPILDEFGWERVVTAVAFSFGFLVTAVASPVLGRLMDRRGPRVVIELGVGLVAGGLLLASGIREPWHLYATLGVLVGGGSVCLSYTGQSLYLPNWFVRRRGLAMSLAFSGVGVGSVVLLPWLQTLIERAGWRAACRWLGAVVLVVLAPLNLLLRRRPEDLGLAPDGDRAPGGPAAGVRTTNVVDAAWVAADWTLARALGTARFWWIAVSYLSGLYAWYAVQVHQTRYLVDRIGREWVWTVGNLGFALCSLALILLRHAPTPRLVELMVVAQGLLGYGLVAVIGAIPADVFQGAHYGAIFGSLMLAAIVGGAAGPWATGAMYDATGGYALAFGVAMGSSALSAGTIWLAAPRTVRAVAGRAATER